MLIRITNAIPSDNKFANVKSRQVVGQPCSGCDGVLGNRSCLGIILRTPYYTMRQCLISTYHVLSDRS
jgi:hypothetical protein